jgi:hypothetical protein
MPEKATKTTGSTVWPREEPLALRSPIQNYVMSSSQLKVQNGSLYLFIKAANKANKIMEIYLFK